jgi:rare lipoprotein A
MKKNHKSITFLFSILLLFVVFSFASQFQQEPKQEVIQDTLKKPIAVKDEFAVKQIGNLKLQLLNKNGHASYYADKFTGRRTASGKIFNNNAYTCANKTMPFGTKLKITCIATKKSVIVIVTDRGPFVRGRDIDLSKRAFMDIAPRSYGGSIKIIIEKILK